LTRQHRGQSENEVPEAFAPVSQIVRHRAVVYQTQCCCRGVYSRNQRGKIVSFAALIAIVVVARRRRIKLCRRPSMPHLPRGGISSAILETHRSVSPRQLPESWRPPGFCH
jgi:hypothetical protein